ncbi:MAG: hypothetical protein N4A68_05510 [Maledivibacter sp.]|nr:hypothetical protein [Maledivibacter sp.]
MDKRLQAIYNEWRKDIEEHNEWVKEHGGSNPVSGTWDCGESCAREDFSSYANLEEEITFEEMLELEKNYSN